MAQEHESFQAVSRHLLTAFSTVRISAQTKTDCGPADIFKTFISFCQHKTIHVHFRDSQLRSAGIVQTALNPLSISQWGH